MTPDQLTQAAFWDHGVCLACRTTEEDFDADAQAAAVCVECDRGVVVSAKLLSRFVEHLEAESD